MTQPHSMTLILASQRTGSKLLCDDVASLGGMGQPKEQFNKILPWSAARGESDVIEAIAKGHAPGEPGIGSVKMMVNQARSIDRYLRNKAPVKEPQALQNIIDWAKVRFERVMVLVIIRENHLDQAISRIVARQTKIYHSPQGTHKGTDLLDTMTREDPGFHWKILEEVSRIKAESDTLLRIAEANSDVALLVRYEKLAASAEHYSTQLVEHATSLGFAPRTTVATRTLRKVIDTSQVAAIKADFAKFITHQVDRWVADGGA